MLNITRNLSIIVLLFMIFSIDAKAQKINQFNEQGKRHGIWKKYYKEHRLRYQGTFDNGKEIGVFTFYENSQANNPVIKKEYHRAHDTAMVIFYNTKGKIKSKGKMFHKNREGRWTYFFTNGKILSEENYRNGMLNGLVKNYYPSGIVTEATHYLDGKKHGGSKVYANSGVLLEDVNYLNGKLDGEAKYYDLKGELKQKGAYSNGVKRGKWEFYLDGELVNEKKRARLSDLKNK